MKHLKALKNSPIFRNWTILALLLFAIFGFSSCDNAPVACFTVDHALIDLNEEVEFLNCTEPLAQSYEWSFDDGSTSTDFSPKHRFKNEGQFLVALKAKAKVSTNDDALSIVMKVGQRLLGDITINSIPSLNTSGSTWDPSDGPDVKVLIKDGNSLLYQTQTLQNSTLQFPLTIPIGASVTLIPPRTLTFEVVDEDGLNNELMTSFEIDLAEFIPNTAKTVTLNKNSNALTFNYTLR